MQCGDTTELSCAQTLNFLTCTSRESHKNQQACTKHGVGEQWWPHNEQRWTSRHDSKLFTKISIVFRSWAVKSHKIQQQWWWCCPVTVFPIWFTIYFVVETQPHVRFWRAGVVCICAWVSKQLPLRKHQPHVLIVNYETTEYLLFCPQRQTKSIACALYTESVYHFPL